MCLYVICLLALRNFDFFLEGSSTFRNWASKYWSSRSLSYTSTHDILKVVLQWNEGSWNYEKDLIKDLSYANIQKKIFPTSSKKSAHKEIRRDRRMPRTLLNHGVLSQCFRVSLGFANFDVKTMKFALEG